MPSEVREMWEAARGLLLYGWFFYAIYAIGEHELSCIATSRPAARRTRSATTKARRAGPT